MPRPCRSATVLCATHWRSSGGGVKYHIHTYIHTFCILPECRMQNFKLARVSLYAFPPQAMIFVCLPTPSHDSAEHDLPPSPPPPLGRCS